VNEDLIKEHLDWLNGEMPSQKNIYEKDFSEAPIYRFYYNRQDTLTKLYSIKLEQPAEIRKVLLNDLIDLLRFIQRS